MTQSVLSHDLRAMLLDITVPLQTFADYVDVPMDRVLLEQCMDFVEARYSEDAKLRGVLSRLGIMLVSGDPEAAFRCFEVDDRNGRITTVSRLYFAELLARKGLIDQAKTQVDTAYQLNPYFTDGYGRVAWELHWRAQKYELVVAGFVHDEAFGRLSSHGRVRLATALAAMGDLPNAEAQVFAAYREDSNVPNGYALIGWHYFMRRHRFADVLEYIERDRSLGRLAPEWTSNHALVLAAMGRLEDGISMVERGYAGHSHLRDCFTAMGWHLYTKHGEIGTSINLMRRDAEADRLSPSGMLKLVELLGQQTTTNEDTEFLLKESLALVQRAYALDGRLQDGHCALARGFTFTKDIEMVVALYLADLDQGRMSSRCFFEYVRYLCMAKGHEAAAREIEKAYEIRADLAGAFTILGSELIKRGEPELAAGYYEHDRILNRMPQGRAVSYAQLLANLGRVDELHQLLKTNLVTPDVYRFQALSLARRFVPDETWPRQAVPDANTCDPGEVSRMLAAMAPQARVEACRAFAEYHYERRAGLMDCLSCGARSALHEGDSDKALALFAGDRDLGRAENQSLLQYSSLLGDEALARKVREEALARYGFAQDPWLTASRDRHEGQRCFLVGTGPSMKRIDCGLLKGEVVFAVNGAIYLDRLIHPPPNPPAPSPPAASCLSGCTGRSTPTALRAGSTLLCHAPAMPPDNTWNYRSSFPTNRTDLWPLAGQ